ncbi:hypothetical protein K9B35_00770 [Sphingomonas sp. R647]|uniref:hypothetical protein n=1 Tax=Sphingomonas sp. R647 TaxID=2875233 RepID=UPI001CD3A548|nr:hypothetical protein [Sphingomonas sp. R647]MCA1196489.1 hypothetical protein [Sphingomonas sp. R647]
MPTLAAFKPLPAARLEFTDTSGLIRCRQPIWARPGIFSWTRHAVKAEPRCSLIDQMVDGIPAARLDATGVPASNGN